MSVITATIMAAWVNLTTTKGFDIFAKTNVLVLIAIFLFIMQYRVLRDEIDRPTRRHITDLLRLAAFQLAQRVGDPALGVEHIRGSFHVLRKHKFQRYSDRIECLCLVARFSLNEKPDTGAIDLTSADNKKWFFNVQAFHGKKGIAGDVDTSWTPSAGDGVAPTMGTGIKGIISFPVIERAEVIGTITFDSTLTAYNMKWIKSNGGLNADAEKTIVNIAALIRRTYLKNWDE